VRSLVASVRGLRRVDPGLFTLKRAARAAIAMPAVFAFAVLYSARIGGYFAGATAAMLAFLLPANVPADASVIPARLEGSVALGVSFGRSCAPARLGRPWPPSC
jgi:hypothetical protein